jgi:hypothetical protein
MLADEEPLCRHMVSEAEIYHLVWCSGFDGERGGSDGTPRMRSQL